MDPLSERNEKQEREVNSKSLCCDGEHIRAQQEKQPEVLEAKRI